MGNSAPGKGGKHMMILSANRNDYIALPTEFLYDGRLSWEAIGLLAVALSMREDEFLDTEELIQSAEQRKNTNRAIKELIRAGYLIEKNGDYIARGSLK